MASLLDLPNELLLQVAGHLSTNHVDKVHGGYGLSRHGTVFRPLYYNPDTNLRHLCLAARRLRPIACEVLYRYPKLSGATQPSSTNRPAPLVDLLRTLIDRPDLARFVQSISLVVYTTFSGHTCKKQLGMQRLKCACHCGYDDLVIVSKQIVERQETPLSISGKFQGLPAGSRPRRDHFFCWLIDSIRNGCDVALARLIVQLLPNLKHMDIRTPPGQIGILGVTETFDTTQLINDELLFGTAEGYNPTFVPGLASLRSITSNFVLPWSITSIPTLKTLEFEFRYEDNEEGVYGVDSLFHQPSSLCWNISSLVLNLDVKILDSSLPETILHTWIRRLLKQLTALKKIHVRTFYEESIEYEPDDSSHQFFTLGQLLALSNLVNVEELVVDSSDMGRSKPAWEEPFESLPDNFPNLQRLALPQNAMLYYGFTCPQLPSTIEIVEIIDSTRLLNAWAKYVLESKARLPHLRRIVLWCDRELAPLVSDNVLREIPSWYDPGCGRDPRECERELHKETGQLGFEGAMGAPFDWVGDEIWDQVRDAGIEVVFGKGKRGWRRMSR